MAASSPRQPVASRLSKGTADRGERRTYMSERPTGGRGEDGNREREGPLAHDRRRYVLYCLHLHSAPMTLADVAEQVLAWETEGEPEDYLRERLYVYNDLYHEHLPALCEADLLEYDQREDVVDLGPAAERYEPALERHLAEELGELLHAEHGTFGASPPDSYGDGLYAALAIPDRRRALYYLLDRDRASPDELADVLAGWRAADGGRIEPEERARVLTALERTHLPLLEEVGLVTHDVEEGVVRLRSITESVRDVVRSAVRSGTDRPLPPATVGRDEDGGSAGRY